MTVCACDRCPVLKLELPRAADLSLGIQGRQRVRPGPLRLRAPHNFTIPKRCPTRPTLPSSSGQRHHLAPKSCLSRNRERAFWAACERPISSQRISCDALAWALFWHASGLSLFAAAAARKAKRSAYAVSFIRNGDDTSVMANENSLRSGEPPQGSNPIALRYKCFTMARSLGGAKWGARGIRVNAATAKGFLGTRDSWVARLQ